jgi:surface carbohydrate biosynthesis protein
MKKRVLLVIDNSKRELLGSLLLARYLGRMGIQALVTNTVSHRLWHLRYSPDAIVFPNVLFDLSSFAKSSFIFILPSESGNGQPGQIKMLHGGTKYCPIYPDYVAKFFCWGEGMRQALLETGRWKAGQLAVTGSPATDHWLLPYPLGPGSKKGIGITTSFRGISSSAPPKKNDIFEWLDLVERDGADGSFFFPPEHAESWLFFEASLARVIVALIREVSSSRGEHIELRPHMFEREDSYRYIKRMSKGKAVINRNGTISEWLANKALLFTLSSGSAIDAVVRRVPVVSLKGLIDRDAWRKIPGYFHYSYDEFLWPADNFTRINEYIDLALKDMLQPCRDEKKFYEFLSKFFFFPRVSPSAELIAREISRHLDHNRMPRGSFVSYYTAQGRSYSGIKRYIWRGLCRLRGLLFPAVLNSAALYKYLRSLGPGKVDIGFSFQPWRFNKLSLERRSAEHIFLQIEKR